MVPTAVRHTRAWGGGPGAPMYESADSIMRLRAATQRQLRSVAEQERSLREQEQDRGLHPKGPYDLEFK